MVELEKILYGVTVSEYCESEGRRIQDFELLAVHSDVNVYNCERTNAYRYIFAMRSLQEKAPEGTVAILNYSCIINEVYAWVSGIALVPRKTE